MQTIKAIAIALCVIGVSVGIARAQWDVPDPPHPSYTLDARSSAEADQLEACGRALNTALYLGGMARAREIYWQYEDLNQIGLMADEMRGYLDEAFPAQWTRPQRNAYAVIFAHKQYIQRDGDIDADVIADAAPHARWLLDYVYADR